LVFAGGATITDTGLMVLAGDVTLSDGDLDGVVLEHSVKLPNNYSWRSCVSAGTATIGQESETAGLLVFAGGADHRYRFNGYLLRDVGGC
jgi:hypothetical protein